MRDDRERDHDDETKEAHANELFDRYLTNNLSPAETDILRAAVQRAGMDLGKIEQMRTLWTHPRRVRTSAQDRIAELRQQLNLDVASTRHVNGDSSLSLQRPFSVPDVPQNRRRALRPYLLSATVAAAMLVAGWFGRGEYIDHQSSTEMLAYTTANGQQATVTLPDGSTVLLNVGSQLKVPANYATGNRNVKLQGAALFTVNHHHGTPFTVTAGHSTTRVLGTQFVVRHYATDTAALVAVRNGKVAVGSTVLSANEQAFFGRSQTTTVEATTPGQFTFAAGVLTIDGLLLRDAVKELNRWYDADIQISDDVLAQRRVTGGFPTGALSDLAERLEWTFNAKVVRSGRVLTLYSK